MELYREVSTIFNLQAATCLLLYDGVKKRRIIMGMMDNLKKKAQENNLDDKAIKKLKEMRGNKNRDETTDKT